MFLVDVVIVFI